MIGNFLNANEIIKKKDINFKKTKTYKSKNDQKVMEEYREKIEKDLIRYFFESEEEMIAEAIFFQLQFITTMDKMDWDLLIAYTMIRADDKDNKKRDMIWDKLERLIAGDSG